MDPTDLAMKQPRYAVVANTLLKEIRQGRYNVGELLPTESQLCDRFSVSRATVREALRRLGELKLISKVHGVGTRVEALEPRSTYTVNVNSVAGFMQYGVETEFIVTNRSNVALDVGEARPLGISDAFGGIKLTGYRIAKHGDSRPISYAHIYIPDAYAAVVDLKRKPAEPYYRMIAERFDQQINSIDQEIRAVAIDPEVAAVLDVPAGSPGLFILRRFFGAGRELLEVTINIHPAERFSHRMLLNKENA